MAGQALRFGGPIGALLGAAGHVAERGLKQVVAPEQTRNVAFYGRCDRAVCKNGKDRWGCHSRRDQSLSCACSYPEKDIKQVAKFWDLARRTYKMAFKPMPNKL